MKPPAHIAAVFGTRPEAIKMAPVVLELARDPAHFRVEILVTAQHREMLDQVLDHFRLKPQHDLDIMTPDQSLTDIMVRAIRGVDSVISRIRPDMVLVHGDTGTTLAGALAAFHNGIPVGHVEAGLRSGDRHLPFPEEMYRRLTGVTADVHFAPTPGARANLEGEGVDPARVLVTGNTVIDALLMTVRDDHRFGNPVIGELAGRSDLVLVEVHRRENWGPAMESALGALKALVRRRTDITLLFSVHRNPRVREVAERHLGGEERVYLLPPLDYPDWVNLMARARLVVTDSGGLQEEAPALGVPVLLLREQTERPEALESGAVRMVGTDPSLILESAGCLLDDGDARERILSRPSPYGDGRACERIRGYLLHRWGWSDFPPEEFR